MKQKSKKKKIIKYIVFDNDYKTYKTSMKKVKYIKIMILVKEDDKKQKKIDKSQRNKFERHIEHLHLTENQINKRAVHKIPSLEETILNKERESEIIRAIWNLPTPQNRRVYMSIVDEFSLTEIAKIENCSVSAIKQSLDIGMKKLRKILKNF